MEYVLLAILALAVVGGMALLLNVSSEGASNLGATARTALPGCEAVYAKIRGMYRGKWLTRSGGCLLALGDGALRCVPLDGAYLPIRELTATIPLDGADIRMAAGNGSWYSLTVIADSGKSDFYVMKTAPCKDMTDQAENAALLYGALRPLVADDCPEQPWRD